VGPVKRLPIIAIAALAALALVAAGCGSSSNSAGSSGGSSSATTVAGPGPQPSASSRMICSKEAQTDIATSLGVTATVSQPTWVKHVYACKYMYPTGVISLSVMELASSAQVTQVYNADAKTLGRQSTSVELGQGAFITTNGSVIVRKDNKVLKVDVSGIPKNFGSPPQERSNVALSVAATVMNCWTGA
jgi:hypothetical protein